MKQASRFLLGVALAGGLVFVPVAGAAPLDVHNPSFETACDDPNADPDPPCEWTNSGNGVFAPTITRDTSVQRTGQASMKFQTVGSAGGAYSNCFAATGGTAYFVSFYYTAPDMTVSQFSTDVTWYTDAGCASANGSIGASTTPTHDTAWHLVSGAGQAPPGTVAGRVQLNMQCSSDGCVGNFDDVTIDTQAPTAVQVASLAAKRSTPGVGFTWRTRSLVGPFGFNGWRRELARASSAR